MEYMEYMEYFDTALICKNGHIINTSMQKYPADNQNFCSECVEKAISTCTKCGAKIKGDNFAEMYEFNEYIIPSYCHNCGESYPWIGIGINSIMELIELQGGFTEEEKELFSKELTEITSDTPRIAVGILRIKKLTTKVGPDIKNMLINVLGNIATEYAKKELGLK